MPFTHGHVTQYVKVDDRVFKKSVGPARRDIDAIAVAVAVAIVDAKATVRSEAKVILAGN